MPQIQGSKGGAVPIPRDSEALITTEMEYHRAKNGKGKQKGILSVMDISPIE
jgi:hypothetical protein